MQRTTRLPARDGLETAVAGLGWFSIGLGVAELLAPRLLDEALGVGRHESLTRSYGVREIAAGLGILLADDPTPWVWARVAGDAVDLASIAPGLQAGPRQRRIAPAAAGSVALIAALDAYCAYELGRRRRH